MSSASTSYQSLKSQSFTSSGNFTVPGNVTEVIIEGYGGGGGGSGADGAQTPNNGGNGSIFITRTVIVNPGDVIAVTVGAGGAGGVSGASGANGGDTIFGSLATFKGAGGGAFNATSQAARFPGEATGGVGNPSGAVVTAGQSNVFGIAGGAAGTGTSSTGGGGGGAGPGGAGGAGGVFNGHGNPGAANTGAGGGSGGQVGGAFPRNGGAGGSGLLKVSWVDKA